MEKKNCLQFKVGYVNVVPKNIKAKLEIEDSEISNTVCFDSFLKCILMNKHFQEENNCFHPVFISVLHSYSSDERRLANHACAQKTKGLWLLPPGHRLVLPLAHLSCAMGISVIKWIFVGFQATLSCMSNWEMSAIPILIPKYDRSFSQCMARSKKKQIFHSVNYLYFLCITLLFTFT